MDKIEGTIYKLFPQKQVTPKFTVREFVIESEVLSGNSSYTHYYPVQATGRNIALTENFTEGMPVDITVGLNGRRFNRKDNGAEGFMVTLNLVKINSKQQSFTNKGMPIMATDIPDPEFGAGGAIKSGQEMEEDDLPF